MCKYCELSTCTDIEQTNNYETIALLKDGSTVLELCLGRYIVPSEKIHRNQLMLSEHVSIGDSLYNIKEKAIKIKYCPFCGEEL